MKACCLLEYYIMKMTREDEEIKNHNAKFSLFVTVIKCIRSNWNDSDYMFLPQYSNRKPCMAYRRCANTVNRLINIAEQIVG